jgi:hypothetical protein
MAIKNEVRFPDAVQRVSDAPQIRDRCKLRVCNDPGSAAHHFMLRCARETNTWIAWSLALLAMTISKSFLR